MWGKERQHSFLISQAALGKISIDAVTVRSAVASEVVTTQASVGFAGEEGSPFSSAEVKALSLCIHFSGAEVLRWKSYYTEAHGRGRLCFLT